MKEIASFLKINLQPRETPSDPGMALMRSYLPKVLTQLPSDAFLRVCEAADAEFDRAERDGKLRPLN